MRSDNPLIKHISKTFSPKVGWAWQTLPLIEMPISTTDDVEEISRRVKESSPSELRLPFDDFVLDFWAYDESIQEDEPSFHVWARVSRPEEYLRRMRMLSPWCVLLDSGHPLHGREDDVRTMFLIVETWTAKGDDVSIGGPEPLAFGFFWDPFGETRPAAISNTAQKLVSASRSNPVVRQFIEVDLAGEWNRITNTTMYLTICPEYLVEVQPEIPTGTPPRRKNDPKPWTYDYLPRIILLEPGEAPTGDRSPDLGGTHASPRPHQRRGHWATLKHPRYERNEDGTPRRVFVKPTWVGPREWIMQGNRYRVLTTGADS